MRFNRVKGLSTKKKLTKDKKLFRSRGLSRLKGLMSEKGLRGETLFGRKAQQSAGREGQEAQQKSATICRWMRGPAVEFGAL